MHLTLWELGTELGQEKLWVEELWKELVAMRRILDSIRKYLGIRVGISEDCAGGLEYGIE